MGFGVPTLLQVHPFWHLGIVYGILILSASTVSHPLSSPKESMQYLIQHGARILVLGDRGAGKSSLINAAFGRMRAKTGVGLSVTQNITLCHGKNWRGLPVFVW